MRRKHQSPQQLHALALTCHLVFQIEGRQFYSWALLRMGGHVLGIFVATNLLLRVVYSGPLASQIESFANPALRFEGISGSQALNPEPLWAYGMCMDLRSLL